MGGKNDPESAVEKITWDCPGCGNATNADAAFPIGSLCPGCWASYPNTIDGQRQKWVTEDRQAALNRRYVRHPVGDCEICGAVLREREEFVEVTLRRRIGQRSYVQHLPMPIYVGPSVGKMVEEGAFLRFLACRACVVLDANPSPQRVVSKLGAARVRIAAWWAHESERLKRLFG